MNVGEYPQTSHVNTDALQEYFSLAMLVVLPAVVAFGVWLERPELILLSALQGVVLPLKEIRGQYCFNDELKVQMSSFSPLSNPEHREAIRTLCWALAAFAASTWFVFFV